MWTTLPEQCVHPITDGTHQTPTYTDKANGIPFLSSKDVTSQKIDWTNIKYITKDLHEILYKRIAPQKNDILLAKNGTTGVAAIVEDERVFDIYVTLAVIRPSNFIDPKFLLYIINSVFCKKQFNDHLTGIGLPNLHLTDIKKTIIPVPPFKEQVKIVDTINRLFKRIDVVDKGRLNTNELISQTKAKILDLAIHGKLVPQDPTDEPASKLLKRINPKAEITSDNGHYQKLPEGWCLCDLSSLCKIKGGKRIPRGRTFSKERTPHIYIRVSDMKNNTIITTDLKYIDDDVYQTIKNYTISSSDLYLTIAGTIGHVGIVPKQFDGMNLTENAAKLTGIICDKKYLLYSLLSSTAQEHFKSRFHQVAQPKLSIETASSTMIYLPPLKEQHRIVSQIEEIFAQLDTIEASL